MKKWWNSMPAWVKYIILPAAGIGVFCVLYVIVSDLLSGGPSDRRRV